MTTFLVNEIYPCLQGEGPNLGLPALLVRFQICNLRCVWCDTPYTHTLTSDPADPMGAAAADDPTDSPQDKNKKAQNYQRMSLEQLIETIQKKSPSSKHLILSGGEPTLQNLGLLMRSLAPLGFHGEVESNATRIPHQDVAGFQEEDYLLLQWNLSPKMKNSGQALNPAALAHWSALAKTHPRVFFKFVICEPSASADIEEIFELLKTYDIPRERVYWMAEGNTRESQQNSLWLHDLCLAHGVHYSPRLHVWLFGEQRGV
jgi:organic radical activating enzyme